ncbi:hypothetical protein CAC42_2669 [Sphaceloma murrayae]|uniref:Uncharacterized protein n=1 Tax=Sphaceloma murrayae TaxID=2082308 RepID=A0A2K1QJI4_9PEZI|nr:hypothetical protein CAC42_2669 [Sphaceloma murrayae]
MGNDDQTLAQRVKTFRSNKDTSQTTAARPAVPTTPTAFMFCKESELPGAQSGGECSTGGNHRSTASETVHTEELVPSIMENSNYGVQSLDDALEGAFPDVTPPDIDTSHSRPTSRSRSEDSAASPSSVSGKKRKAGNPVHPRIMAAGQRIISGESRAARPSSRTPEVRLPTFGPNFQERLRSMSNTSAQTPSSGLSFTPNLEPFAGLTPGSGSPRSVRLSDDDAISFDDSSSQALLSSSGEEDEEDVTGDSQPLPIAVGPQLVMPSVRLPTRRPFTERGRQLGRMRILVARRRSCEKADLIDRIIENCADIVHADSPRPIYGPSGVMYNETRCSTKALAAWTSEAANKVQKSRRQSLDNSLLERNISFVGGSVNIVDDTNGRETDTLVQYVEDGFRRTLNTKDLDDTELLSMLTNGGGLYPDVVLYELIDTDETDFRMLARLSAVTNVCLVSREDTKPKAGFGFIKEGLDSVGAHCISLDSIEDQLTATNRPLLLSGDSDLLTANLLSPLMAERLRYTATQKLLTWRRSQGASQSAPPSPLPNLSNLPSDLDLSSLLPTHPCSTISSPSGVLVPFADSSFYQPAAATIGSASPALSGHTIDSASRPNSALALATLGEPRHSEDAEIKEVRLAQWALDLQKSLEEDRRRQAARWTGVDARVDCGAEPQGQRDGSQGAVVRCASREVRGRSRRRRTRASTCEDVCDPLGILRMGQSFRRDGLPMVLRIVGIGGAVGTVALWVVGHWECVGNWFGWHEPVKETIRDRGTGYALGWGPGQGVMGSYEGWGLRGLVDDLVGEVGRLRPVTW